jgi:hypothetical protein
MPGATEQAPGTVVFEGPAEYLDAGSSEGGADGIPGKCGVCFAGKDEGKGVVSVHYFPRPGWKSMCG